MLHPIPDTPYVFLAEDDPDDRQLFTDALNEIDTKIKLAIAGDGVNLMQLLHKNQQLPIVIFLDLNMPRKNGIECLMEIKENDKLKDIPVVVVSTSCQDDDVAEVYEKGASYYICKPNTYRSC